LRIAAQVHHSRNQNFVTSNLVQQSEWKAMRSTSPASRRDRMPRLWKSQNAFDASVNLIQKADAEAAHLSFVVKGCFS
jgi:hypothetical protein